MKKPTSSTVTPSSSDWASEPVVIFLVGLAIGVREGLVPNFGTKTISKGEYDYIATRDGDKLIVRKDVNFWNRQAAQTNVASQRDKVNAQAQKVESAKLQMDGANDALKKTLAKLEFCRPEDKATEEAVAETWVLTADEHKETYLAAKAKLDDAEALLKEFQAVTFPDAIEFTIDLTSVTLA
jgi:hypothetical protein